MLKVAILALSLTVFGQSNTAHAYYTAREMRSEVVRQSREMVGCFLCGEDDGLVDCIRGLGACVKEETEVMVAELKGEGK